MNLWKSFWVGLAVLVSVVCLSTEVLAEQGVTDTEVKFGAILDLSGPIAFMGKGELEGIKTYFRYINDQGGIHGRKLVIVAEDDMYSSPKAVAAAKKLIERDEIFALGIVLGSAQALAMYPILERAGVPLLCASTNNSRIANPPKKYMFMAMADYHDQAAIMMNYAVKDLKMENPKVAVLYQDDEPGQDWLTGSRTAAKHYGLNIVAEVPFKRGSVDFSSHVAKLKQSGAELIMFWGLVREPAAVFKEAQKVQYQAVWMMHNACSDPIILKLAGDPVFYQNGVYAAGVLTYPFADKPAVAEFLEAWSKYNNEPWSFYNYFGWGSAVVFVEALKRAGRDLTRDGLIKAIETFREFDSLFGPLTFTSETRSGAKYIFILGPVKKPNGLNSWYPITPWIKAEF